MTLNCLSELVYKTIFRNTNELSMIASDSLHFFYYPTSFYKTVQDILKTLQESTRTEPNHREL